MTERFAVAVIDDWLEVAERCADWTPLQARADVRFFSTPFASEDAAAAALAPFDAIVPMRERMRFPASLLTRLPRLKMLALTGFNTPHVDTACCAERGVLLAGSGIYTPTSTAELALALILGASRHIAAGDATIRQGRFQQGLQIGDSLEGKTLGIVGLGRIGARVAGYAAALGMRVIAWSPNLTADAAAAKGAALASREDLFATSDVISVHMMYSPRSHHLVGAEDLARMRRGALLVNTARAALIEPEALLAALREHRIRAALDVFEEEPLPAGSPLLDAPNTLLSPHLGFSTRASFDAFYGQSVENILAFLDGAPKRMIAPA